MSAPDPCLPPPGALHSYRCLALPAPARRFAWTVLFTLVLCLPAVAVPANDNFSSRAALPGTLGDTASVSNVGATLEAGEPNPLNDGGASVWWSWTAPSTGWVHIDTFTSDFDTIVYVFTGPSLLSLNFVKGDDDSDGEDGESRVTFFATSGVDYKIAVHGYDEGLGAGPAYGTIQLAVSDATPGPPANDDFAGRIALAGTATVSTTGSNERAGIEVDEPDSLNLGGSSVWWSWTAPASAPVQINTFGSDFDTVLYVYTGINLATLTQVAVNDEANPPDDPQSQVNFVATMGVTYQIAVHGFVGAEGSVSLQIDDGVNPPVNDNFANRTALTGTATVSASGSNIAATLELLEPDPLGTGGASVWWEWTAPAGPDRWVAIDTFGSSLDTLLYVFDGGIAPILANLALIGVDDDSLGVGQSQVRFLASAGVTYQIAVHGFAGGSNSNLFLNINPSFPPPGNNDFANPAILGDALGPFSGSNVGAGIEVVENPPGTFVVEPDPLFDGGASVWWRWTAPSTGAFQIDTLGSAFDTLLYVFTGSALDSLATVVVGNNAAGTSQSRVTFAATMGTVYHISVHGDTGVQGSVSLNIADVSLTGIPANDNFASRTDLGTTVGAVVTAHSNVGANIEVGEPDPLKDGGASVWWEWEAPSSGWFRLNTAGSTFDTILYVFSGATLSGLAPVALSDSANGTLQSEVFFEAASAGEKFQIAVHGDTGVTGDINLEIAASAAPESNDNFATPAILASSAAGTNLRAGVEFDEPNPLNGGASVWWTWTAPPGGGWFTVDTFGSSIDTLLYVFTGDSLSLLEPVAIGDEAAGLAQSSVTFEASPGVVYKIAVHGDQGARGSINLSVTPGIPSPSNDNFADRDSLGAATSASRFGTNVSAGIEVGEPDPLNEGGASVWWEWTSNANAQIRVESFGSNFDTVLYVFRDTGTAALPSLTLVGANDDSGGSDQSRVNFFATNGVTYYFALHGKGGRVGSYEFVLGSGFPPPSNNDFSLLRPALTSNYPLGTNATGANLGATLQTGEPTPLGGGASVWWTWIAPAGGGWVRIDTFGSSQIDSLLYVFTGSDLATLNLVAASDNSSGTDDGLVNFFAAPGETYRIAVHGVKGDTGSINLNIGLGSPPPANDNFAGRFDLPGTFTDSTVGSNTAATLEINEPDPLGGGASLWWTWTAPPSGGWVEFNTAGSNFDTILYVFTGTDLATLTPVAINDNAAGSSKSKVNFAATGGVNYKIAVHGDDGDSGSVALNVLPGSQPPANDDFSAAVAILTPTATGNNLGATTQAGEKDPLGIGGASAWWKWTAPSTDYFEVDTMGSDIDTVLYVFTGADLPTLVPVGANNDGAGTVQSVINFSATSGTTYYFAVHGNRGVTGSITINLHAGVMAPANDDFANCAILDPFTVTSTTGSNLGASLEFQPPEPDPLDEGGASVWWSWTAPSSGYYQVNTLGSSFDTVLYVFVGNNLDTLILIGANDEAAGTSTSRVNFNATAGVTYRIAVHGDTGETGSISLALDAGFVAAANDFFSGRVDLGTIDYITATESNEGAGREIDEITSLSGANASIWWSWTAPATGPVKVSTGASDLDTVLFVYTGLSLNTLTEIAADDDSGPGFTSEVEFAATIGTTYHIAVHGSSGDTGTVNLLVSMLSIYDTWLKNFPSLTGANALRAADPDEDGLGNLSELALGLNPLLNSTPAGNDPDKSLVPQFVETPTGIEIHYTLNPYNLTTGVGQPIQVDGGETFDFINYTLIVPTPLGGDNYKVFTPFLEMQKQLTLLVTDPNP